MKFKATNNNPKAKTTGDCVVRSISLAEGKDWLQVYKGLVKISYRHCELPNTEPVYEEYLRKNGWRKQKVGKTKNGRRYRVNEVVELTNAPVVIVLTRTHMTCVKNGEILDTWNCKQRTISCYYVRKEDLYEKN